MKATLFIASLGLTVAINHDDVKAFLQSGNTRDFGKFAEVFEKSYDSAEEKAFRETVYHEIHDKVDAHNAQGKSWTMGINQFSDLTDEEFSQSILMDPQDCSATTGRVSAPLNHGFNIPKSVDWREKGMVTAVKNQQKCGSCWTFSTVGCLEAHVAILNEQKRTPLLSEQQLVECAQDFDNHGCNGGLPSHAFEYLKHEGSKGLHTEFTYPYIGKDDHACRVADGKGPLDVPLETGVVVPGGSVNITEGDEDSMAFFLATRGPVSLAYMVIDDFRNYAGGVYTTDHCKDTAKDVNHAVLAVGYGTDAGSGLDYWTIKNSWSPSWGDEGYFKLHRGVNMCGCSNCNAFPDLTGEFDAMAPVSNGFVLESENSEVDAIYV